MADISIPEGDNPVRYQASLGGNQKYRNMGNVSGQAYLVRGQVTNVYYQKGTLDFNTYGSSVTSGVTDGSGSAPIPVDFWGKNTDGKVFGCYRPVQKGSQILVAYIGGDTSRPIVIGVYPDNEASYELISPVHYNTGDDSTDDVQNDALGERKIYPNQQMMYESGKGDILRSMGGKSFLYISENGSGYLDDINYAYDEIRDFYDADANEIEPTMTKAQSWLLVHEDNDSDEAADGHRTRFYVNRSGELMVTFANKDDPNNIVVLEASKDSGFKLTKRFDNSNVKEDSEDYVQFGIGNGNNVSIKSVDSGDATSFYLDNGNIKFSTPKKGSITFDGVSVNGLLGKVSDAESAAKDAADKADNAADKASIAATAGDHAKSAASEAASQALAASYAGEDAKSAAVEAQAAGEDAKAQAKDTQQRIIYYASISNEKDVAVPGKYIIVNTDTYIANGTIKTAHIGDAAITNAKIADLAVGTAQLEDAAITRAKIGNLAVGTAQIEDAAITDAKVGDLSADHLNAGTIDFSVISGIHINASEIDVGKIVADQIFVKGLGDISKNLGTVTSGKITGTNVNDDINTVQSGVNDLNDPNLMTVIEKQTAVSQYAGLTSQYNVILARAKDDNISTTDLTTAYTNLDTFMTPLLADTTNASGINRDSYMDLTDAYNMALSNVQTALKDSFNADIDNMQSSVSVASQAASSAVIVASQAAITGDNANQVASRAIVVANDAQSAGNNAISVANNASQAASDAVIAGSTAAVNADKAITAASQAKIAGDNATSVANNASQAASGAVIAGSTAAVNADKAITAASQAKIAGDNATSVANNATSIANSAKSTADSTYTYANSEIAVQSTATAKAQSTADNAFSKAQAVGSQASAEINSNSTATAKAQSTADNAFSKAQEVGSQASAEINSNSTATAKAQSTANNAFSKAQEVGSQASAEIAVQSTATAKAQSTADNAFSKAQAVGSQASAEINSNSTATAKAQSTADNAFSKAQAVGSQASAEINSNSTATAKAQSTADNAFSQATTAIDNGKVTSQAVTDLKDGSKLTIAELENGLATKVANSDYASYKEQTASQIAQKVDNGAFSTYQTQTASQIASKVDNDDFSTYQTQTADLIASKVANKDFTAYQATTAKAIESKVESSDFNTYQTQTADLIDDKVSSSEYASDKTQTASEIADKVSNSAFSTYQTQTASQIAQKVDNDDFSTYQTQTADLIASKVANEDFTAYQATTATAIDSKVESSDFNTYKTQTADAISSKVSTTDFNNLTISNRNLALGTATAFKMTGNGTENNTGYMYSLSSTIAKGTTITLSFDITSTNATGNYAIQLLQLVNEDPDVVGPFIISKSSVSKAYISPSGGPWQGSTMLPLTAGTQHCSYTLVTNADYSDGIKLRLDNATGDITLSNLIISESSKEVSWTPAPEDQATQSQITQLSGEIEQKVNSGDFNTYQTQTADLIAEKVANKDFNTYKTQTADLIDDKVSSSEYASDKTQTASEIADKVSNSAFSTYQTQTADLIDDKVSSSEYASDRTQTASEIADRVSNSAFSTYQAQTASQIASKVDNGDFSTYKTQTADLIASKVANKDFSAYQATTAKSIESKVESNDFNTYKSQTADLINDKVSNSEYASDKTQTASQISQMVSNSAFSAYQTQTASQIAQTVSNSAFSAYQQTTADLIASKVATKDFSAYQATTAKSIESKVESSDFNTYKTQTADLIDDKVSNSAYASDKTQTASEIADRVSNSAFSTYQTQTASQIASKVDNGDFSTYKTQTANLIAQKVANSDFSAYQATTAKAISSKVESSDFNTYKTQTADEISSKVSSTDFNNLKVGGRNLYLNSKAIADDYGINNGAKVTVEPFDSTTNMWHIVAEQGTGAYIGIYLHNYADGKIPDNSDWSYSIDVKGTGKLFYIGIEDSNKNPLVGTVGSEWSRASQTGRVGTPANKTITMYFDSTDSPIDVYIKLPKLESGNMPTDWAPAPEDLATQSQFTQLSGEIDLRVTKGGLVDQINVQAGKTLISSSGQLILSGKSVVLDSVDPVIMKSANIGNMAVGTAQIANGAITNAQIGSLAVDTANIKDAAINSAKIANLAVGTAQIGDGAITNAKIGKLAVGTAQIANGAITDAQIGSLAVGTAQIKDEAVNSAKIANLAVGTAQIGDGAITNAKIGKLAVGTAQIANAAITDAQIGNVSANKLTAGTIDFNTITGKNINASNITTGTLDTNRLNVNKLSALSANLGDVTTGSLKGVDIIANTFSTPNGSFTTDSNGAITAKSMSLTDGKVSSSTISASTINGSSFYGGSVINNSNNTAGYYPMSIDSLGTYNSTYIDDRVALRASIQSGAIVYNRRSMSANSGHYPYYDTVISGQGVTVSSGYTTTKDTTFSASITPTAYIGLTTSGGLFLHGSDANIDFGGHLSDSETETGMYMNPYGNIIGKSRSDYWQVSKQGSDNTGGGATARFGIDTGGKGTINFYRPLFVDEIGGFTDSNGNALFIHGNDDGKSGSTGQMLFRKDDRSAQIVSSTIYNRTYSNSPNVYITSYGTLGRATSASKYKLDITKETSLSPANKLLSIDRSSWVDKESAERLADSKTNGTDLSEPEMNVFRHYGLIAEDLIKAGLDEFVIKGDKGQAEGIEYDRLWTVLIPKIRQLSNDQIQNKMTIAKLESEIEELKQGR